MTSISPPTDLRDSVGPQWNISDASDMYGIDEWGAGLFGVNDRGNIVVRVADRDDAQIDLNEVIEGLRQRGIHTPVLLRFSDIQRQRMQIMRTAFDKAILDHDYTSPYSCVYPIKVNQQAHVCREIRDNAADLNFGLEAGSKPELLAVLALTKGYNQMPIICNGFKDEKYIEACVLATKLGRNITPVVEKFSDLVRIVHYARKYKVRPKIGLRVKLASRGAGRWEDSAGARSKFGLFVSEIIEAVELLRGADMLDCLGLLHCHIGSQVSDIRRMKNAINELAHVYTELVRLGAKMGILDVGGGLGVDYDGSKSDSDSSLNYSIDEYAADVVYRVKAACDDAKVEHPMLISESGRALVAYSSVLVVDVVGASRFHSRPNMDQIRGVIDEDPDPPQPLLDIHQAYTNLNDSNLFEAYHDAVQARDETMSLFNLGYMSLPARAAVDRLFWAIGRRVLRAIQAGKIDADLPEEIAELDTLLSDTYFCNFSIFQSVPDMWAIDQHFPICPIHRLDERPTRHAILADLTCDSDGKIDHFVSSGEEKRTLELHTLKDKEPYYLGIFLVGAYQETLGDLHNLFGDTHAVHIHVDDDGDWIIDEVVQGDTVEEVLQYVQFDPAEFRRTMRRDVEKAVKKDRLTVAEGKSLLRFFEEGLAAYTYLEE